MAVELRRLLLRLIGASGGKVDDEEWPKTERDVEYYRGWNDDDAPCDDVDEWAAAEAMLKRMAGL